jgi:hypothetical protein
MRLVYANNAHPSLYGDLWCEIATFSARRDVLNLRSISTDLSKWVDKSITSLSVTADQAPAMVAALGHAKNLNHIRALRIENCANDNLPGVIQALTALPHAPWHVEFVRNPRLLNPLYTLDVQPFSDIAPASLRLSDFCVDTAEMLQGLARLNYPIHLATGHPHGLLHDENLPALANIPHLVSLDVMASAIDDGAAQALGAHPTLTELHLHTDASHRLVISDRALAALANSVTLRTLHLARVDTDFSEEVIAALAGNRSLAYLCLGGPDDVFDESFALALSRNTILNTLHIAVRAGCGHLAHMRSLEHLFIGGKISLDDARQFAKHAHLRTLHGYRCEFAPGALAVMVGCPIKHITLENPAGNAVFALTDTDIDAFLGNTALRSLSLVLPTAPNTGITQAIRLARHPTLTSLSIRYLTTLDAEAPRIELDLTLEERTLLAAAWGQRPTNALSVTIL